MRAPLRLAALAFALALLACSDSAPPPAPSPAAPAPAPAAAQPAAVAATPDPARGKLPFESYCLACHGPRGDGDGPAGVALDPRPAHIGDRAYMSAKTDDYLFDVIKNGGASVGRSALMAPWGALLSDLPIRDVIAYVRSLAH